MTMKFFEVILEILLTYLYDTILFVLIRIRFIVKDSGRLKI